MIISHRHRLIFFSNPKTGSESLRALLAPLAEEPVVPFRRTSRKRPFYPHMPPEAARRVFARRGWDFSGYRRITCIRNPYARLVSLYEMIRAVDRLHRLGLVPGGFGRWLRRSRPEGRGGGGWRHQRWRRYGAWSIRAWAYDAAGAPLVDHILRLEDLNTAWPDLAARLGLPDCGALPHLNRRVERDHRDWYDAASRRLVAERYGFDLAHFSYSFDN